MRNLFATAATTLAEAQYSTIALLLPAALVSSTLIALLYPALAPGADLQVRGSAAASEDVSGELRLVGLAAVQAGGGIVSAIWLLLGCDSG